MENTCQKEIKIVVAMHSIFFYFADFKARSSFDGIVKGFPVKILVMTEQVQKEQECS
jgi:hypothetical protein